MNRPFMGVTPDCPTIKSPQSGASPALICGLPEYFHPWALVLIGLFAFLPGCAADPSDPPTIQSWQQDLERYVWDRGNGDPNVVADLSWDDVHKGFAVIGDPLPRRSTDQIGLLVGHKLLQGNRYFVFLLGTVRKGKLRGLRAVALRVDGGAFHWAIGPDDPKSLLLYRNWSRADRAAEGVSTSAASPFPRLQETFSVTVENERLVIRHQESGARWEVRPPLLSATRATGPAGS